MNFIEAYTDAKKHVEALLEELPKDLLYHCKGHTFEHVLPAVTTLSELLCLGERQKFLSKIAALFHDTGYLEQYNDNEIIGSKIAKEYMLLHPKVYKTIDIDFVTNLIDVTSFTRTPKTIPEKMMRDADLVSLGLPEFLIWSGYLQGELLQYPDSKMHSMAKDDKLWATSQLSFISGHTWWTDSAKKLWEEQKVKNIANFKKFHRRHLDDECTG